MSELQLALFGAGIAAVAGIFVYNRWQERRYRRLAEQAFRDQEPIPDVLLPDGGEAAAVATNTGERIEPVLDTIPAGGDAIAEPIPAAEAEPVAIAVEAEPAAIEPMPVSEPMAVSAPEPIVAPDAGVAGKPPAGPRGIDGIDELADCIVGLHFADGITPSVLSAGYAYWANGISKPVLWLGYDGAQEQWRRLGDGGAPLYRQVLAAVQLVDRRGPIDSAELALFLEGVRRIGEQNGGKVDLPAAEAVIERARALDQFCVEVDLQVGLQVADSSGQPFPGTKLRGIAEAMGMTLQDDGCFHARTDTGQTLYTLGNLGPEPFTADGWKSLATHGLVFSLDVPRVPAGPLVFDQMVSVAQRMAHALSGVLVDPQRHPLSPEMIAGIRCKIVELQQKMAERGIVAGRACALRLFL